MEGAWGTSDQLEPVLSRGCPINTEVYGRDYRFLFGSYETDNEAYGSDGTSCTARFWQYDSRVGRRWNMDPVVKPWESSYATFANNPIFLVDFLGADSSLYNSNTGAFMARGVSPQDDKTAIWTVDPTAKGYNKDNPWATASKLTYTIPSQEDEKGNRIVTGQLLRNGHALTDKGWKFGDQVFEEDLLDMTSEFDVIVNQWKHHFAQKGAEWDKAVEDWLDCRLCSMNPSGYTDLLLGKKVAFIGMVGPNMPFDLKSQSRRNRQQIPSYAAVIIGQYSFYHGRLMNYDDYGNIAFGAWGRAYNYDLGTLTVGANIDQMFHTGRSDPGRDQYMIKLGFGLFK